MCLTHPGYRSASLEKLSRLLDPLGFIQDHWHDKVRSSPRSSSAHVGPHERYEGSTQSLWVLRSAEGEEPRPVEFLLQAWESFI